MRHHFGDMLDRGGGYWTIIPNRQRYAYRIGDLAAGSSDITMLTIGRQDEHWQRVHSFPNLEELTLYEPSQEQLQAMCELRAITRVRITHARTNDIEFMRPLVALEELVLEYVSGFSDLSPLGALPRLRAVHFENLRKVRTSVGCPARRA
jgi:hypothetical protein